MKKILLVLLVGIFLVSCKQKNLYCGVIVGKYISNNNHGDIHNVVFYSDSLKANISVRVKSVVYDNIRTNRNRNVCFMLSNRKVKKLNK